MELAAQTWTKLGLVYCPDGSQPWSRTHALAPTPVHMPDGGMRVYFSTCDADMRGSVSYVDLDPADPTRVLYIAKRPVIGSGADGCFDDNGVNATCLVWQGKDLWMYYFGYQLHQRVRYTLFSGLAISRDGGETFERVQETPILDRIPSERFVRSAPFVTPSDGGYMGDYTMTYVSGDRYIDVEGKQLPSYELREIRSLDGLTWEGPGRTCLELRGEDEFGFGRPFVVKDELFFSLRSRSKGYRLGHARRLNGRWVRDDELADFEVSPSGWDSDIVCYASAIESRGRTYMFYNGNGYGATGFGACVRNA